MCIRDREWPCQNGGTCYATSDINIVKTEENYLGYTCFCSWGYSGINCDEGEYWRKTVYSNFLYNRLTLLPSLRFIFVYCFQWFLSDMATK